LNRFVPRLTYANVVATLALFLALGGGAYAAFKLPKNSVGPKQIKANAVNSSKVANGSLLAGDFEAGQLPTGPQGLKGDQGIQGIQGIQGSASASAAFGGVQNLPTLAGGASVFTNAADTENLPGEGNINILTPNAAVTLRDLAVREGGANLPANVSLMFTLDGPSSSISCTIPTGSRSCDSGAQTATVPPASEMTLTIQNTGTASYPESPTIEWAWRATG
jgi:hypothetical protein